MVCGSGYIIINISINHHHHHIHFRALFSSTEGWAFWQVFLEGVLSTQNDSEGQQNPYLASFCHSQALHPMISLACQIFSVQPHSACVLLQSSLCCALHVQTISSYLCGAPHLSPGCQALWEGSLFVLCPDIADPMDHGTVITPETVQCIHLHGPSLCCMQHHTPHTWWVHLTSGQKGQMAVGEKGKQLAELAPCTFAACDCSQLAATSCREHVPKVAELWDDFKLFVSNLNLWNFSFINSPSSPKASGAPELRVRAQGFFNATAFLMHPALAAITEDCIRATNSWLTDTTGVLSRFLQHVQINARLHNLCLPHVHT